MRLSELLSYENNKELLIEIKGNKNNIIPFVGAGVSRGCGLFSWCELLEKLSTFYFSKEEIDELKKLKSIDFADKIIEKAGNTSMIMRKIRSLFDSASVCYTEIPFILLEEFSPLLVTTNYDDIIENVSEKCKKGRITSLLPCLQGQVNDAIQLNERKLLKIHGSIEEPSSFVFSSEQYEISYDEAGLVTRYLKSIFEAKRVLFVGCSIEEDKTIEVLKKCIEKNGDLVHYAILPRPNDDNKYIERNVLLTKLGIRPVYYPENNYEDVAKLLNFLSDNNQFIVIIKKYLSGIAGFSLESTDDEMNNHLDVLFSVVNTAYYETATNYPDLLDIDCKNIDLQEFIQSSVVSFLTNNRGYSLFEICLYGFKSYLQLGEIKDKDNILKSFENNLSKEMLSETEIVSFLQKGCFSHKNISEIYNGDKLLQLSDRDINLLAARQMDVLKYKGDMNFDIIEEYNLAERILEYCSNRLSFYNRVHLLNQLGAFSLYYNKWEDGKIHLLKVVDIFSKMGELEGDQKIFLSQVFNNLAIVELYLNSNLSDVLYYNQLDIELKKNAGASKILLAQSIGLRATIIKELDQFQSLDLYLESSAFKEDCFNESNDKKELISWMVTAFNIGLVAKDLRIYEEALRIISKANGPRLKLLDRSNKDYGSSVNVECELEILLGKKVSNMDLVNIIQSRVDLPKGFIKTQEHTWYVCALYFYSQKKYREAINYINKAMY